MIMNVKEELRTFVDSLAEEDAALFLLALRDHDAHALALLTAPLDDEPTTPEEDASAAEARAQYRRGDFLTADEAKQFLLIMRDDWH